MSATPVTAVAKAPVTAGAGSFAAGLAVNIGFALGSAVAILLLTRLSTSVLDPVALALFLGARRYSASVSALANLGGPLFQIRYMGMHAGDRRLGDLISIFVTTVFVVVSAVLAVGAWAGRDFIAATILPARAYPTWFLGFVVALSIEQLFHFSVQNVLLVRGRIVTYNAYKFLAATGLLFPALLLAPRGSARDVLQIYLVAAGVLLALGHLGATVTPLLRARELPWDRLGWISREAVSYGPPRAFVNFLDSLLFVLPVWLLGDDVVQAGFMLTMFIFVQATGIVILPINELVMVASAGHVGTGDEERLARTTSTLFELLLVVSGALVAVAVPFRDALYRMAIASDRVIDGVSSYSFLLSCIIPATLFAGLKGVIDMRWRRPRNLGNLALSQGILVVVFMMLRARGWDDRTAVIVATASGFWILGCATVMAVRPLLSFISWRRLGLALVLVALGGAVQLGLVAWLGKIVSAPVQFGWMLLAGGACAAVAARTVDPDLWRAAVSRVFRQTGRIAPSLGGGRS